MEQCRLCSRRNADQTGSHIITAWLIATSFKEDSLSRDQEIIHKISNVDPEQIFIGRGVSVARIEDLLGREMYDHEIKAQKNEFVRDNFLCFDCEKRMKVVEDYFKSVHVKIKKQIILTKSFLVSDSNNLLIRMFFYINFWRASICNFSEFQLSKPLITLLSSILDQNLSLTLKETEINCKNDSKRISSLPLIIYKSDEVEHTTSKNVHFKLGTRTPFTAFLNDYLILLYENHTPTLNKLSEWSVLKGIVKPYYFNNYQEKDFSFGYLNKSDFGKIKQRFIDNYSDEIINSVKGRYREIYQKQFGIYPTTIQEEEFTKFLIHNPNRKGDWATAEAISEAMNFNIV